MKNKNWWIIGAIVLILAVIVTVCLINMIKDTYPPLEKWSSEFENMSYHVSPCNQEDKDIFVNITINLDSVRLRQKASYVCCANITLRYEINETTLNIYEDNNGEICRCICNYEIFADIRESNITQVNVYGIYYPEVHPYQLLGEFPEQNKNCAKEGEQFSKVYKDKYPEVCCEGLTEWDSGFDTSIVVNETCVHTGLLAGSPVGTCIKCGDGICELNETICNCPQDCNNVNRTCTEQGASPILTGLPCCSGLDALAGFGSINGVIDCSAAIVSAQVCSDCGNGVCNQYENICNCPEDCS